MEQVEHRIFAANPWKAAGEDGLLAAVWKHTWPVVKEGVLALFQDSERKSEPGRQLDVGSRTRIPAHHIAPPPSLSRSCVKSPASSFHRSYSRLQWVKRDIIADELLACAETDGYKAGAQNAADEVRG